MENIITKSKSIFQLEIDNLVFAKSIFDNPLYVKIVEKVFEINSNEWRIIMSGVWKNSFIAAKTAATMSSIWIPAFYLDTNNALHWDLWMITKKDLVIHLSRSWDTEEMLKTAYHIKNLGFKQVAITCKENCKIKDIVDIFLPLPFIKEADENGLAPSSSSTLLLAVCDTIWLTVSSIKWFKPEEFYACHPWWALGWMLKDLLHK